MSQPLSVGIVGSGFMSSKHAEAWKTIPGVRVTALCSRTGRGLDGKFSHVAGNLGEAGFTLDMTDVFTTTDWSELIAEGNCDIIDICTPTHTHPQIAVNALKAGKHVFVEKPAARTSRHADEIGIAADKAKRMVQVGHCMQFWPDWAELKPWFDQRLFGTVYSAAFHRAGPVPGWSPEFLNGAHSGGALLDLGVHDYSFVLDLFGAPDFVSACGRNIFSSDGALDDVQALLRYNNGPNVTIDTSWARNEAAKFGAWFEIRCEKAVITGGFVNEGLQVHGMARPDITSPLLYGQPTGWANQLHHFAECIRTGQAPQVANVLAAIQALELVEAVQRAANERLIIPFTK